MDTCDKIEMISEREASTLKHLPLELLLGFTSNVFNLAGISKVNPIPKEYFDAVIYGLYNYFYEGCEPEFETDKDYIRHIKAIEKLKTAIYVTEKDNLIEDSCGIFRRYHSPYQDKSISFLAYPIE